MRTYDINKVVQATNQVSETIEGFHPEEWLANPRNIALINENDDIALFEDQHDLPDGTVAGHYFFFSRGKSAVKAAESFLEEIFTSQDVHTIIGYTPLDHKGALWMNKRLGFTDTGTIDTVIGPCKFVHMSKQQWKDRQQ